MTGRVARARHEPDLGADPVVPLDQIGETAFKHQVGCCRQTLAACRLARSACSSARTPLGRTNSAHWEESAPTGPRPASCSSRRDRRAGACTAPCRSSHAETLRRPDPRGSARAGRSKSGFAAPSCRCRAQVSTMIRRPGASTISAWMLILSRPLLVGEVWDQPGNRKDGLSRRLRQDEATATRRLELHDLR